MTLHDFRALYPALTTATRTRPVSQLPAERFRALSAYVLDLIKIGVIKIR